MSYAPTARALRGASWRQYHPTVTDLERLLGFELGANSRWPLAWTITAEDVNAVDFGLAR